jgi:hypothetical protein
MSEIMELWFRVKSLMSHTVQEKVELYDLKPNVLYRAKQYSPIKKIYEPIDFFISFKRVSLNKTLELGELRWDRISVVVVKQNINNERDYSAYASTNTLDNLLMTKWIDIEPIDVTSNETLKKLVMRDF